MQPRSRSLSLRHVWLVPFQDQVEPVSEDRHPDEPEPRVPPQVEPDGEEEEEHGVQIGHLGCHIEQVLVAAVSGLQVDRQLDPPAVEKVHDTTTSEGGCCAQSGVFSLNFVASAEPLGAPVDFTQGWTLFADGCVTFAPRGPLC